MSGRLFLSGRPNVGSQLAATALMTMFSILYFPGGIFAPRLIADEPIVSFDVPALVGVNEIVYAEGQTPPANEKIIKVIIPVSSIVRTSDRENTEQFRFDVYWNRNVYPIVDYGPKTQTTSDIEGLISVEKSKDKNAGVGINVGGSQELISGSAKVDLSNRSGSRMSYQEIPQHEVLVASGTIQRGTGAFFRFHPSKRDTLEGGRDLIVAYRVPQSWRGGVLKIECRAEGHRSVLGKVFGSWREGFTESRAFVLPIYLEGDDQARQAAVEFVRSEQGLRQNWMRHQSSKPQPTGGLFAMPSSTSASRLPEQWVHHLIQSGNDEYLTRYRRQLPESVASAAQDFVSARQGLFKFSR